MIRMQDQKTENKKNKYVKYNRNVQKAKKIGASVVAVTAFVGVSAAKFGKEAIKHAPELAKKGAEVLKTMVK